MDTEPISLTLGFICILFVLYGILTLTETAFAYARKSRLEKAVEEGSQRAKTALELMNDPGRLLATTQITMTLIGILLGACIATILSKPLAGKIETMSLLAPYSDVISLVVMLAAAAYILLTVGQSVPEKVALISPETIAAFMARPMKFFSVILSPAAKFLNLSTDFILGLLGIRQVSESEPPVTEEEVKDLIAQGEQSGAFEKTEKDMVERIFRLGDMRAAALMTPRTYVEWLDVGDSDEYNLRILTENKHSRYPVAQDSLDEVLGVVYTKDLLSNQLSGGNLKIKECLRSPLYIPKSMPAFKILEQFKQTGIHIAFVIDEFGGFLGLITLNDILEQIVGDIALTEEVSEPEVIKRDDGSWLIDGMLSIDEFKSMFDLEEMPGEEREHYQTLGGFITSYLEHIPTSAEKFEWNGFSFEIVDMDGSRVDKVLVSVIPVLAKESA